MAQDSEVMRGCALEVRGAMAVSVGGRTSSLPGKSVGEMNALGMLADR